DSGTSVAYIKDNKTVFGPKTNINFAALRSELHGVSKKVADDLLQPVFVTNHPVSPLLGINVKLDRNMFRFCCGANGLDRMHHHFLEIYRIMLDFQLSGNDPCSIKQVFD